mgnify:FL=1
MSRKHHIASRSRVLIIEDQKEDRDRILDLLYENGEPLYRIAVVSSLYSGLAKLRQRRFDVILLDLSLPDSVGFRTLDLMLRQTSKIPVIVMTGLGDVKLAERAVKRGAYGYLSKKVGLQKNTLRRLLHDAINRKRSVDEQAITCRFLEIANAHHKLYPLLRDVAEEMRQVIECEAIRIRLFNREGRLETIVSQGFGREIMACEKCVQTGGNQCVCLRIAQDAANKLEAFVTDGGSFFAETAEMLDEDCGGRVADDFRHACANLAYQAAAIVPIRRGNKTFGIVQVADSKPYAISAENVKLLERLACRLGEAVRRVQASEALEEKELEVYALLHSAPIMMATVDSELRVVNANQKFIDFSPVEEDEIIGVPICCGMGCRVALANQKQPGTTRECETCPIPEYIRDTIEHNQRLERKEFPLSTVNQMPENEEKLNLWISSAPLAVAHRRLALLYIEEAYQNPYAPADNT